jgi:C1A family cysteine protease
MRITIILLFITRALAFPKWFNEFANTHNKIYSEEQATKAYEILKPKHEHIGKHSNLELSLHEFADTQRHRRKLSYKRSIQSEHIGNHHLGLPKSYDWRDHHAVTTPIKQGSCGGCFAFAAVGNLEYWYKKKTGILKDFSIQEALDCSKVYIYDSDGCDGGLMEDVFKTAQSVPIGLATGDSFKMRDSTCPAYISSPKIKVISYTTMSDEWNAPIEEKLAHNLLSFGPIPIGIDSSNPIFDVYKSGVIKEHQCGKDIDHAVLVVGYTPTYWILKNSWGPQWGENGYFRIKRGVNACGINSYSSFATSVSIL